MTLSPAQKAKLEVFSKSEYGPLLIDVIDAYILEVKDDVLDEKLSSKEGKTVIVKLKEFQSKLGLLSTGTGEREKNQCM